MILIQFAIIAMAAVMIALTRKVFSASPRPAPQQQDRRFGFLKAALVAVMIVNVLAGVFLLSRDGDVLALLFLLLLAILASQLVVRLLGPTRQ